MVEDVGGGASRSTDPAAGTSAATDVSLREYLIQAIENSRRECRESIKSVERAISAADANTAENIKTALLSIDRRFDGVNEFRGALDDLSKQMAKKTDVDNLADKVVAADRALESRFEALYQRNRDDIDKISGRLNIREGQDTGSQLTKGALLAVVTVVVAVLGLIVVAANYLAP